MILSIKTKNGAKIDADIRFDMLQDDFVIDKFWVNGERRRIRTRAFEMETIAKFEAHMDVYEAIGIRRSVHTDRY